MDSIDLHEIFAYENYKVKKIYRNKINKKHDEIGY